DPFRRRPPGGARGDPGRGPAPVLLRPPVPPGTRVRPARPDLAGGGAADRSQPALRGQLGKPAGVAARLFDVAPRLMSQTWDGVVMIEQTRVAGWTADEAVTRLFSAHYRQLVRLAALLLDDHSMAEELVQDAYVKLHQHWGQLRDPDRALGYLRTSVVNAARSEYRHRGVADRFLARW